MRLFLQYLVILMGLLFEETDSFVRVSTIATQTLIPGVATINHVKMANSGQVVYISMRDYDGMYKIKSYNISTGSFVLKTTFT
jgi:hypothetical protein